MERKANERLNEMIVPKSCVWLIEEKENHIEDRFHVEIIYGARHHLDRWIGVKGKPEKRELAKAYIKALVAPTESITVNYPKEMHNVLINPDVHVKLEQQSKAVVAFSPGQRGELHILGCDTLSVTLALSAIEDLINMYLQEQNNDSGMAAIQSPSHRAKKRLNRELRRFSLDDSIIIISEDEFTYMNNAVKRTILGWLQENQEPQTPHHLDETRASSSVPDSPDVIVVDTDLDETVIRQSPDTSLSTLLGDASFCTPINGPGRGSSTCVKQLITNTVSKSASGKDVDLPCEPRNLLTSLTEERDNSVHQKQFVSEISRSNPTFYSARSPLKILNGPLTRLAQSQSKGFNGPLTKSIQSPAKALNSCLIHSQHGTSDIVEKELVNVRHQKLEQKNCEEQSSSLKKLINHKELTEQSSNQNNELSSNSHVTATCGNTSDMAISSDDTRSATEASKKTHQRPAAVSQQLKRNASQLGDLSLVCALESTCVAIAERNMIELSSSVHGDRTTRDSAASLKHPMAQLDDVRPAHHQSTAAPGHDSSAEYMHKVPDVDRDTKVTVSSQLKLATLDQFHVETSNHTKEIGSVQSNVASSVQSKVASSVQSNVASSVQSKVASSVQSNVASSVQSKVASSVQSNVASSVQSKVASSVQSKVASSVQSNVASSVQSKVASSVQSNVASSVQSKVASSVQSNVASSVQSKVASSVQSNVASSVQSKVASSVQSNVASSVQSKMAPSVQFIAASSVQSKVASSVQSKVAPSVQFIAASSVQSKVAPSVQFIAASSVQSKVASSVQSKVESSVQSIAASSVQSKVASSVQSKVAPSVQSKVESSVQSKAISHVTRKRKPVPAQVDPNIDAAGVAVEVTNAQAAKKSRLTLPSVTAVSPTEQLSTEPPRSQLQQQSESESSRLRYIVIDGSNVAMSHGNGKIFSCKGIQLCVNYFRQRGHKEITAFVPQWRTQTAIRPDYPIREQYLLNQLKAEGVLVFTPSRRVQGKNIVCYDDRFHLRLADTTGGVIVSNDNFRDLWNDVVAWRDVIEKRLLMYSFVGDLFMVPDDPLGRNGPSLDQLLAKPLAFTCSDSKYKNTSVPSSQQSRSGLQQQSLQPQSRSGLQQQSLQPQSRSGLQQQSLQPQSRSGLQQQSLQPQSRSGLQQQSLQPQSRSGLQQQSLQPQSRSGLKQQSLQPQSRSGLQQQSLQPQSRSGLQQQSQQSLQPQSRSGLQQQSLQPQSRSGLQQQSQQSLQPQSRSGLQQQSLQPQSRTGLQQQWYNSGLQESWSRRSLQQQGSQDSWSRSSVQQQRSLESLYCNGLMQRSHQRSWSHSSVYQQPAANTRTYPHWQQRSTPRMWQWTRQQW